MKERKTNLELLRILCMIMIVTLHCLSCTGLLNNYKDLNFPSIIIWIIEILCFGAVNIYVLIGSYLMCNKQFSIKRIIKLWLQVFFYSILITIIFSFFELNISKYEFITYLLPISFKIYWFPTIYIGLMLFSPFLNKFIKSLTKRKYKTLIVINVWLFSIIPFLIQQSSHLNFGGCYSIVWFINLYLISGYIKLHLNIDKISKTKCICGYLLTSLITFMILIKFPTPYFSPDMFYSYHFILILIASSALFILFLKIHINNKFINKIILIFSPLTFGVYLIHEHPLVRNFLWSKFSFLVNEFSIIKIIIIIIGVYLTCSFIDWIRNLLFKYINMLINKSKYLETIDKKVTEIYNES